MLCTFAKFVQFFFANVYNISYFLCVYNVNLHYKTYITSRKETYKDHLKEKKKLKPSW